MNEPIELDPSARDVIAAGRDAPVPNEFVAERLRRSIERTLHGSLPPARSKSRMRAVLAAFGAVALGGALYATELVPSWDEPATEAPSEPRAPSPQPRPRPVTPSPVVEQPAPEAGEPTPPNAPATRSGPRTEVTRPARSQQLGAEIELLARVNAAVNAGDGGRAVTLLAEYDRRFGAGILAEERAAASVLALCAAGRTGEARAAAERFARRWPRSPLAGRVAGSCAGAR